MRKGDLCNGCVLSFNLMVRDRIMELVEPRKIILFGLKTLVSGETSSFKLCVVTDSEDRLAIEKMIYIEIDCEIPFDIVVYTTAEWNTLSVMKGTFANRISETGSVLYG